MGVAVLPPQDFLRNHRHPNKPRPNPNPNPNPNTIRSSRRRRNSPPPQPNTPPVMGPIRILKRDEDLSPQAQPKPKPKPKPGPIPDGFYAGSAFVTSPPPSSLPLPAFFTGRRNCGMCEARDPVAETVLRRALKLQ